MLLKSVLTNMSVKLPKNLSASVFLFNKSATMSFFMKEYGKMQKFGRNID